MDNHETRIATPRHPRRRRGAACCAHTRAPTCARTTPPAPDPHSLIPDRVLAIIADKTGYPIDMLDLDLDLEADLGIDTVKQAETFAALRDTFDLPRDEDLRLADYPTLEHVIAFVRDRVPTTERESPPPATPATPAHPQSAIPRRLPIPVLRPPLEACKSTGMTLDANSRVVVALDEGGIGRSLMLRLERMGVTVLGVAPDIATVDLAAQLDTWLAEGPIHGVYWLPALDAEPDLPALDLPAWRELNRRRVKNLYTTMRTLYDAVAGPGRFLVAATRLGGLHGYGPEPATAPLGGAVAGFTKAYRVEQNLRDAGRGLLVKAVDFAVSRKTADPADRLIAETLADPGVVEVGYYEERRYGIALREAPPLAAEDGLALGPENVFLVTGAAGGITSAIVADLAAASGGAFYLLDLVDAPPAADPEIELFRHDPEALKQRLIEAARGAGERPTPAAINRQLAAIERRNAARRAVEAVEAAGGTAFYHAVDLRDAAALKAVMADVRERHGRLDALIHAGGVLVDRTLPDKAPEQFNLVFDVKVDGLFSLLRAAGDMPLGAVVSFSSVAGRFGNNGQSDYSAANDLLCKLSSNLRRWRPETRALAIDWTAWGEIGMAARGSVPQIMEALGVDMLPPAQGIPVVRQELTAGTRGELVIAGRLGAWLNEADPEGGLDPDRLEPPGHPLIGRIVAARLHDGLQVETPLDPRAQPFLFDHAIDGTPLLPGVMGVEAMAELATVLAPDCRVTAVEDVQFHNPCKFYRMEPVTLTLEATLEPLGDGALLARTLLRTVRPPARPGMDPQEKLHFTAIVRLSPDGPTTPEPVTPPALSAEASDTPAETIYQTFFHGPAYQVLERVAVEHDAAVGLLPETLPPDSDPPGAAWLMAPRLVELIFQTAGVWKLENGGKLALPTALGSVTTHRPLAATAGQRLLALVKAINGGDAFDGQVVDDAGHVYVSLRGYQTIDMPD